MSSCRWLRPNGSEDMPEREGDNSTGELTRGLSWSLIIAVLVGVGLVVTLLVAYRILPVLKG